MRNIKVLFAILILLFIYSITHSQSGWVLQNSSINTEVTKIFFIDTNTGWYSTGGSQFYGLESLGIFAKTTNAGLNWNILYSCSSFYNSFYFINNNTGWSVMGWFNNLSHELGREIYKTTNSGSSWTVQYSDNNYGSLTSVYFINENIGMVAGNYCYEGLIFRTSNSGTNWEVDSVGYPLYLNDIYLINISTGYTVGGPDGQILKTTNFGSNWVQLFSSPGISFYSIYFYNSSTAWVGGSRGMIAKTTNSGINWTATYLDTDTNNEITQIKFVSSNIGFATVLINYPNPDSAKIFKTTNGGNNWFVSFKQSGFYLNSVFFNNVNTGWAAGGLWNTNQFGNIYKTTTSGEPIGIKPISNEVPFYFQLSQNYPNPFNPTTKIKFDLPAERSQAGIPKSSFTKLIIYDILGREVTTLVNEQLKPGSYDVEWDGSRYASGIYFYKLTILDPETKETLKQVQGDGSGLYFSETKKLILLK